jgi:hypothetical protein
VQLVLIGSTPPFRSQKKFYEQEAREKHEVRETQEEEKRGLEKRLEETTKREREGSGEEAFPFCFVKVYSKRGYN